MLLPLTLLTAMALGWPLGSQAAAATLLIVAVVVARATDGLVSPLLYRVAGDPYPETERQAVTQWVWASSPSSPPPWALAGPFASC